MLPEPLLDALRPPRLRPALWHALADLARRRDPCQVHHHQAVWFDFLRRHRQWHGQWARTPELACVGLDLLSSSRPKHERVEACIWLTLFPSLQTVEALARIALDPGEDRDVRNQAVWTLGYRQLQEVDDTLRWKPDVVAAADDALLAVWRSPDRNELDELLPTLRHVSSPLVLDALAQDVIAAAPAIEAYATPTLAHALVDRLEQLPSPDAPRILRLVGHVLGCDVAPRLLSYAASAPLTERVEAMMTALALDADRARGPVEAWLSTLMFDRVARDRAAWHQANPGVLPTVRALAVARQTAAIEPDQRTALCLQAARNFASSAAIEPFPEEYLYAMWRHVAYRAWDDAAVVACVESLPSMLEQGPFLVAPYIDALAHAGRFDRLAQAAREHACTAHATWLLATHGRPFAALAMRRLATADGTDPEAVAGGILALFLAGRPDLASLALERDRPRAEYLAGEGIPAFPGPDELWRIEHEPARCPALAALVSGGLPGLLSCIRGAPEGSDPDPIDFALVTAREQDLRLDLSGATVCFVGSVPDARRVIDWLQAQGAIVVDGPFANTSYFVAAPDADPAKVSRLRAMGVRELPIP
ncbi:MAG: hypothetical protein HY898_03370 [Deltaproteobacteria bacterium]|nr:hypothetical protein [Deltaproteobacteria bacterium]